MSENETLIGEWIEMPNCENICSVCGGSSGNSKPIDKCPHCDTTMRTDYVWPSLYCYEVDTGKNPFENNVSVANKTKEVPPREVNVSERGTKDTRKMNILVACEESQAVTTELRKLGHNAYSCDIIECSGGHPEWHIKDDVLKYLNGKEAIFWTSDGVGHITPKRWDMIIAFPPCTHLAVSGARHFEKKRADGRQREGIEFFCQFLNADCDRIAIENPVGIISGDYIPEHFPDLAEKYGLPRKPTQIIQPYEYGHAAKKTTCLWLKGLPNLVPTNIVEPDLVQYTCKSGKVVTFGANMVHGFKSNERAKARSKTFEGVAKAMANQWAGEADD